jgi:cyclic pyranopterin phosphate synthase
MNMNKLTHIDTKGRATMVDVGEKDIQRRIAKASGYISLSAETIRLIKDDLIKKGDVLSVARLAGINAAKQTAFLIPLCHNIVLENVKVDAFLDESGVRIDSEIKCTGKTGVEMEALTAVSVALLTVYDMCKAVDKSMTIRDVHLTEKVKL